MFVFVCWKIVFGFEILQDSTFESYFGKKLIRISYVDQSSCKKQSFWFSVSFSFQKYSENFSRIEKLAIFLQDSCKILNQD